MAPTSTEACASCVGSAGDRSSCSRSTPPRSSEFWLADYLPEVIAAEQERFPTLDEVTDALAAGSTDVRVDAVPVPWDCVDGFGEAYYGRPEAYLRPEVRAATSGVALADPETVRRGLDRLADDLASGAWDRAHGHLRTQVERTGALRLVTATA